MYVCKKLQRYAAKDELRLVRRLFGFFLQCYLIFVICAFTFRPHCSEHSVKWQGLLPAAGSHSLVAGFHKESLPTRVTLVWALTVPTLDTVDVRAYPPL